MQDRHTVQPLRVRREDVAVVVIDVQPFFLDGWMAGSSEPLIARLTHLFGLAVAYDLPLIATFEQPVEQKGWLPSALETAFPAHGQRLTKQTFDCCGEASIREALRATGRKQLAVAGGETDVCVLQSVLGLIGEGYEVFLLEDCLFSEEPLTGPAVRRMEAAGAVPATVKTLAYELRGSVERPPEKDLLQGQGNAFSGIGDPEDLPPWNPGW
jgi:nicotinamidase-related amidase